MRSLYYFIGDAATSVAAGVATAALSTAVFGPGWWMPAAMLAGMAAGMALSFVLTTVSGIWFGAFENMLPAMLSGMTTGMVVAMRASMHPLTWSESAQWGACIGLACLFFSHAMNLYLRGEQRIGRQGV